MESKVREYQELHSQFEMLHKQVEQAENPIRDIEKEIKQIKSKQGKVNYNDPNVVIGYMETYIEESIAQEKESIKNDVNERMSAFSNPSSRAKKNFDKVVKWLSRKKVVNYLNSVDVDLEQDVWVEKADKAMEFNIAATVNTIFAYIFRFDFLKFAPKVVRIIASVIFWAIFLIPKLLGKVHNKFQVIYDNELAGLSQQEYEMLSDQFTKEFLGSCISSILITAILIVLINIGVYFAAKHMAKKYLADNKLVCLAFVDFNGLTKKMYDYSLNAYMEDTVAGWKTEIEMIKKDGLSEKPGADSLVIRVKNNLYEKYNALQEKIDNCEEKIRLIQEKNKKLYSEFQDIIPRLKAKEKEVDSLISDSKHNGAVLSPYVATGYSQNTVAGVKELVHFKHNYKPMLICYNDDTAKDGERYRKNVARLVELFMHGFFQENYYEYINMWLVDFEGLYFPENRTKGLMKVIRTQQGLQQMFEELKATREVVDSLADGRIANINPTRLENRENPIKYNIVYFVGHDFSAIEREISQLFIGGENFGFLPIVFMKKSLAQSLISENSSSAFSRVIEKMRDNSQIYEFEGLVSEFEFDLMVSDQKRLLDEKVCVNKIMSMDDFIDVASSDEGLNIDGVLYLDTYQLDKEVYEAVMDIEYVRFFTINGDIPGFIEKEVINL